MSFGGLLIPFDIINIYIWYILIDYKLHIDKMIFMFNFRFINIMIFHEISKNLRYMQQNKMHMHNNIFNICFISGVCPVLCSSHGHYGGGICHCEDEWKGPECDVPIGECQIPGCSGHGRCNKGECICDRGWKGQFCDQRKCLINYGYIHYFIPKIDIR